jgi:hypothetical protein
VSLHALLSSRASGFLLLSGSGSYFHFDADQGFGFTKLSGYRRIWIRTALLLKSAVLITRHNFCLKNLVALSLYIPGWLPGGLG